MGENGEDSAANVSRVNILGTVETVSLYEGTLHVEYSGDNFMIDLMVVRERGGNAIGSWEKN